MAGRRDGRLSRLSDRVGHGVSYVDVDRLKFRYRGAFALFELRSWIWMFNLKAGSEALW